MKKCKYYLTRQIRMDLLDVEGYEPGSYGLLLVREGDEVKEWFTGKRFTIEKGIRPDGSIGEKFIRPGICLYNDTRKDDLLYIGGIQAQLLIHKVSHLPEESLQKIRQIVHQVFACYEN